MTSLSCTHPRTASPTAPSQGDCVRIQADDQLYQVIGLDDRHDRCWLRRWPLTRQGSEVFEISLQHVQPASPHHS